MNGVKSHASSMAATGSVLRSERMLSRMTGAAVTAMLRARPHARSGMSVAIALRKSRATPRSGTSGENSIVRMLLRCFHDDVATPSR